MKNDVAACVGATWIAGGFAGTIELLVRSLKTWGTILIGEPPFGGSCRPQKMLPRHVRTDGEEMRVLPDGSENGKNQKK